MGPESGGEEVACQSQLGGVITTGGGFSTYYPTPDWQKDAVQNYFSGLADEQTPVRGYNPNGRAYPDVSMIGVHYETIVQGQIVELFGTSAAAPVFGAMVSLINAERFRAGKPSVGFLNPTLYSFGLGLGDPLMVQDDANDNGQHTTSYPFNDVTAGDNKCAAYSGADPSQASCCGSGFYATAGWDPLTGWGSVDYPLLAQMLDREVAYNLTVPSDDSAGSTGKNTKKSSKDGLAVIITVLVLLFVGTGGASVYYYWMSHRGASVQQYQPHLQGQRTEQGQGEGMELPTAVAPFQDVESSELNN
jgi:hypothetical protein